MTTKNRPRVGELLATPRKLPMAKSATSDAFDGQHLLVADKACAQCLFSKNKLVTEEGKREILRDCYKSGSYFICHEATIAGRAVICHNFAKSTNGAGNQAIRVAQFFGVIKYVEPGCPTEKPRKKRPK